MAVRRSQYVLGRDEDTAAHPPGRSIVLGTTEFLTPLHNIEHQPKIDLTGEQ